MSCPSPPLCFHYYCLSGHWGDVNQSLGPEKQKCSPENLVGITHSQITFFYSENPTKIGPKGTQLLTNFQKLQISLLRKWKTVYKKSCRGQKVSLGGLRPPTSNPTLKNLKFGTPWASYGCFGDHLSAFEVEKINWFFVRRRDGRHYWAHPI